MSYAVSAARAAVASATDVWPPNDREFDALILNRNDRSDN